MGTNTHPAMQLDSRPPPVSIILVCLCPKAELEEKTPGTGSCVCSFPLFFDNSKKLKWNIKWNFKNIKWENQQKQDHNKVERMKAVDLVMNVMEMLRSHVNAPQNCSSRGEEASPFAEGCTKRIIPLHFQSILGGRRMPRSCGKSPGVEKLTDHSWHSDWEAFSLHGTVPQLQLRLGLWRCTGINTCYWCISISMLSVILYKGW